MTGAPEDRATGLLRDWSARERARARRFAAEQHAREAFPSDGNALPASPTGRGRGRGPLTPPVALTRPGSIGETVTVESVARDGDDLIWTKHPGPVAAGRPQSFPTTALVTRTGGYYVLHIETLDLVSLGGATVTVTTSSGLSRAVASPSFGRHLRGADVPLGVLPSGTTVTVTCDQPIVLAVATLEHKDIGSLVVADPVDDIPQDQLIAWYRADDLDLADGADVMFWVDRTGNGWDLNDNYDSRPWPKFRPDGLGSGHPAVEFKGGTIVRGPWSTSVGWNLSAIYLVMRMDTSSAPQFVMSRHTAQSAAVRVQANRSSVPLRATLERGGFVDIADGWKLGGQQASIGWSSQLDVQMWRDGTLRGGADDIASREQNSLRLGAHDEDAVAPFDGVIAEVAIYGTVGNTAPDPDWHDTATRQTIEGILADRWGL